MSQTIDAPLNTDVTDNKNDSSVKTAIELISSNLSSKTEHDNKVTVIQDMFEVTFELGDPKGPRKLNSQRLYQALWRTANRMKTLDFSIHGEGRPQAFERIVTSAVSTVLDRGGFNAVMRGKVGTFFNMLMYGDGFFQIGTNPVKKTETPIVFMPISPKNIYVDNFSSGMRVGDRRSSRRMCVIYNYGWNEFVSEFPKFKNKAGIGRVPRDFVWKETERTRSQETNQKNEIEVAYFYDLDAKVFTVFAGSGCTILEQHKGDDYPFMLNGESYIPISQWACIPSSEGFWNHGIGDLVYRLAQISRQLMNQELAHIDYNVNPIELINVPEGEASKFFNKMKAAYELQAHGKRGMVAMEYDPSNPNGAGVSSQTLLSNSLVNEWKLVYDQLDTELRRLGINIDEIDRGADVTATQILAEEENANAFVKQIMEYNATEQQFVIDATMQNIKKFVPNNSQISLNLTTTIPVDVLGEQIEVRADGITMGMVSKELKENNYFTKVNSRSGAIPSNIAQQARAAKMLALAAPGSPAQTKLISQLANLNDIDITGEEFIPAQEAPSLREEAIEEAGEPTVAGTERQTFLPQLKEQVPAI